MKKIIILILLPFICKCQTSYVDSLFFTTVFQSPAYIPYQQYLGAWFINPYVTSRKELFDRLDTSFKFKGSDYFGSYAGIYTGELFALDSLNASMNRLYALNPNFAYEQYNPCFGLPFSLNGKQSTTYCTFSPSVSDTPCTAFLIITGSGANNGTAMIRGEGYQNLYGNLKDSLQTLGDVYIAIRPLLDFRSFVWDAKGMELNSEFPIPSQIENWLNSSHYVHEGTPYGINCLIESIALVKYLKKHYSRVIIAGLSYGGGYTTLNAFESNPEGALISGGYTITVDETNWNNDNQIASFGDLWYSLQRDSIKNNISRCPTQFLFSWGNIGDSYENSHPTEKYFSGLKNVQYFYNYQQHTFPPFQAFKNLIDTIKEHR